MHINVQLDSREVSSEWVVAAKRNVGVCCASYNLISTTIKIEMDVIVIIVTTEQ